jgi:hypothetical protein
VETTTARGGSVRSANQEIVAELFLWMFDTRPEWASLVALEHSVKHLLGSRSVAKMFPWIRADLVVKQLEAVGFVSVVHADERDSRKGVRRGGRHPDRLRYNIQRSSGEDGGQGPQVSHSSRAFSIIVEDILLWLRHARTHARDATLCWLTPARVHTEIFRSALGVQPRWWRRSSITLATRRSTTCS